MENTQQERPLLTITSSAFDKINNAVFHDPSVPSEYAVRGLETAESVALLRYHSAFDKKDILDIGIGTGRTSRILKGVARRYVGIDYSEPMVNHVRKNLGDVEVHQADMRDLSAWGAGTFDFVFASNNVIDAVQHVDRLRVLQEVKRVLRPNGVFAFSSHNRGAANNLVRLTPELQRSRNPLTQWQYLRHYKMQQRNYEKLQPYYVSTDEYAILGDEGGHNFSLLLYFIDPPNQRRQLAAQGFEVLDAFGRNGAVIARDDPGESDTSVLYVARLGAD